jgi:hypothetical protein
MAMGDANECTADLSSTEDLVLVLPTLRVSFLSSKMLVGVRWVLINCIGAWGKAMGFGFVCSCKGITRGR